MSCYIVYDERWGILSYVAFGLYTDLGTEIIHLYGEKNACLENKITWFVCRHTQNTMHIWVSLEKSWNYKTKKSNNTGFCILAGRSKNNSNTGKSFYVCHTWYSITGISLLLWNSTNQFKCPLIWGNSGHFPCFHRCWSKLLNNRWLILWNNKISLQSKVLKFYILIDYTLFNLFLTSQRLGSIIFMCFSLSFLWTWTGSSYNPGLYGATQSAFQPQIPWLVAGRYGPPWIQLQSPPGVLCRHLEHWKWAAEGKSYSGNPVGYKTLLFPLISQSRYIFKI